MNPAIPLHVSLPKVLILYACERPVLDVPGYSLSDPFEEPPVPGMVVEVGVRLPHGVAHRYVEVGTDGTYRDVNGELVENVEESSYRYPGAEELAEWEEAKRARLAECSEETNVRSPWNWNVPWSRPAARCGGAS